MQKLLFYNLKCLVILVLTISLNSGLVNAQNKLVKYNWNRNWIWVNADINKSNGEWEAKLIKFKENNITGILIGGGVPMLEKIIPLADKYGIEVHAWMWTLNRPGDKEAQKHPEWYTISRKGESCYDVRPYVDYYQWVCPSKEEVFQHIAKQVKELCSVNGLKGIHLDYVRYSDVILAKALQPQYNLVQDKEYPEFDFCYCETCKSKFKTQSGIDISKLDDPTQSEEWRQYRYKSVTDLVNRLVTVAHNEKKLISAAVFPYPDLARTICRQSWDNWDLDAVFPMVYQNFYDENMNWIKTSTRKGVKDLNNRIPLITGLYLPAIPLGDFPTAIRNSFKGGAKGVAIFDEGKITNEQLNSVSEISKKYQKLK